VGLAGHAAKEWCIEYRKDKTAVKVDASCLFTLFHTYSDDRLRRQTLSKFVMIPRDQQWIALILIRLLCSIQHLTCHSLHTKAFMEKSDY